MGENRTHRWNEWAKVGEPVGRRLQYDHGNPSGWDVLLELQVLIHSDQDVETLIAHAGEQIAVRAPLPAEISNVCDVTLRKLSLEWTWYGLIQEYPHSA